MLTMLTCLSCSHYRPTGCNLGQPGWPTEHLADCWATQYEPGSDEAEDWGQTDSRHRGQTDSRHRDIAGQIDSRPTNP